MAVSPVRTKHWGRVECERLVDPGAFRPGERLELVGSALVVREPQGSPHATAVKSPIALDEDSEPDIAVVPGTRRDHRRAHPPTPLSSSRWPTRAWRSIGAEKARDREKSRRVMAAIMQMKKIDIGALRRAHEGRPAPAP